MGIRLPCGAEGQFPGVSGTGVPESRRDPDAGDRALLPAAAGDPGGHRPGRGGRDAGICPEGPGERGHPPAENGLHHPGAQRGHVHTEGGPPHGGGHGLHGNGAEGRVTSWSSSCLFLR